MENSCASPSPSPRKEDVVLPITSDAIPLPSDTILENIDDPTHPDFYKRSIEQVNESKNVCIEDIYASWKNLVPEADVEVFTAYLLDLIAINPTTPKTFTKANSQLRRKYHSSPKKCQLLFLFNQLIANKQLDEADTTYFALSRLLIKKQQKSTSGVLVITVVTSPYPEGQQFSCDWNCYYCPNEPDQPRSYLHDEPSVLRANRNAFDPVLQFCDRAVTLAMNGHPVDKIELIVLGGTWASYPVSYQTSFIRDLFYAANTFFTQGSKRPRGSLAFEKTTNETTRVKIIGLTLETRPDCITPAEILRFREFGCTRVQLGLQHTSNAVLKKINRGCTNEDAKKAIRLLRDVGYKLDIHIMPNLPGSSPEMDLAMFQEILGCPDLQADQWKIYPCEVLPWTVLKQWYESGKFVPYDDDILLELLIKVKALVHPWIRLNRVIRDIPSQYILGGLCEPNLRQVIGTRMAVRGMCCRCIRCREVKNDTTATANDARLIVRHYEASGGLEYFISFETADEKTIFGFCRLRITEAAGMADGVLLFPELAHAALIRELHVYGQMKPAVTDKSSDTASTSTTDKEDTQHVGFGSRLMAAAEDLALQHGHTSVGVIAGVGVRGFYRKLGYELTTGASEMMMKTLTHSRASWCRYGLCHATSTLVKGWKNVTSEVACRAETLTMTPTLVLTSSIALVVGIVFARHMQ